MARFRKKPVIIEAWLYAEDNPEPMPDWVKDASVVFKGQLEVRTLAGTMIANRGDWIIRTTKDAVYPMKGERFVVTYEAAD